MADTPTPSTSRDKAPEVAMPELPKPDDLLLRSFAISAGYANLEVEDADGQVFVRELSTLLERWYRQEADSQLRAALAERDAALRENRILTAKCAGSLANNLCPDHRDKQAGQPCLACAIETLTRERDTAHQQSERWQKSVDALRDERDALRLEAAQWRDLAEKASAARDALRQELEALRARDPHAHWITSDDGLSRRNPAPHAAPAFALSPTRVLTVQASAGPAETLKLADAIVAIDALQRYALDKKAPGLFKHHGGQYIKAEAAIVVLRELAPVVNQQLTTETARERRQPLTPTQVEEAWAEASDPNQPEMSIHAFAEALQRRLGIGSAKGDEE